jgi:hypothetical protein
MNLSTFNFERQTTVAVLGESKIVKMYQWIWIFPINLITSSLLESTTNRMVEI